MGRNRRRGLPDFLKAGVWSGMAVGVILAFAESMTVLIGAGPFLANGRFFIEAVALNGLAGFFLGGILAPLVSVLNRLFSKKRKNAFAACFSFYLAGGIYAEILIYLLDTYAFGGRNKGSQETIGVVLLAAAACGGLAFFLRAWMANAPARKWPFLFSPDGSLGKAAFVFGLVAGLGFLFWLSGQASMAGEMKLVRTKKNAVRGTRVNVILLVVDSLRPDHMSSYGYPLQTTPSMDKLASNGIVFPAAVAASSWTRPAQASLFTGLYPSSHGAYSPFLPLETASPTLAEILAGNGYQTLSVYANPLLGGATGLDRGFDRALGVGNRQKTSLAVKRLYGKISGRGSTSAEILNISLRWIGRCRKMNVPYFVFINVLETHAPYKPRQPYFKEFCSDLPVQKAQWSRLRQATSSKKSRQERQASLASLDGLDLSLLSRLYDSNIRFLDQRIKVWAERLQDLGGLDRSLLVISSDHGEFLGEHGQLEHGTGHLYDPVLRIPLIFYCPQKPARSPRRLVSQVDIFPTILHLLALDDQIPAAVQGANLFSSDPQQPIMAEFWDARKPGFVRALYAQNLKLIQEGDSSVELYDLARDPQEKTNLIRSRPEAAAQLIGEFERLRSSLRRPSSRPDEKKTKALERLLKGLGYIK